MNWNDFTVDPRRCLAVVDGKFFQLDMMYAVEEAKRQYPKETTMGLLPSWAKFAAEPMKASGFFTIFIQAFFNGMHNRPELEYKRQRDFSNGVRVNEERSSDDVYMMFLPSNIKSRKQSKQGNSKMDDVVDILKDALIGGAAVHVTGTNNEDALKEKSWLIVTVTGENKMKGKNAQDETLKAIELAKSSGMKVLIVASCQAQRSYSIPSLCNVLLCYDGGQSGATNQKGSRAFTPDGTYDKVGRIISCSFNPERDDKFDAFVIQAASNIQKRLNIKDMATAIKMVLDTLSFSRFGPNGSISMSKSAYLQQIMQDNRYGRVLSSKLCDIRSMMQDAEVKNGLFESNFGKPAFSVEKAETGKTFAANKKKKAKKKSERKMSIDEQEEILKEKIECIVENRKVIIYGAKSKNITEAIEVYDNDKMLGAAFLNKFGMTHDILKKILDRKYISTGHIDVMVAA